MDIYSALGASMQRDVQIAQSASLNVANVATPGFKRWITANQSVDLGSTTETTRDLSAGKSLPSGSALDIYLPADVYVALDAPGGDVYSRGGRLRVDADGRLMTAEGLPLSVVGDKGKLGADVTIAPDGRILQNGEEVGRLIVVHSKRASLAAEGVYQLDTPQEVAAGVSVLQTGAHETSNVNITDEMITMMKALRHLESVQRVLRQEETLNERVFASLSKF